MNKYFFISITLIILSACSITQRPRYAISVDNIYKLKSYEGVKVEVLSFNKSAKFDPNCRLMGPIELADGLTIPQFISKAFNDEFKMAGIYSIEGIKLSGDVTKIEFTSVSDVTNGYWDIGLRLNSSNGKSLSVSNKYTFKSGFDALTACNATADALSPAVQDLIKATINHPEFGKLLE
jgi:hypothetical protein